MHARSLARQADSVFARDRSINCALNRWIALRASSIIVLLIIRLINHCRLRKARASSDRQSNNVAIYTLGFLSYMTFSVTVIKEKCDKREGKRISMSARAHASARSDALTMI